MQYAYNNLLRNRKKGGSNAQSDMENHALKCRVLAL